MASIIVGVTVAIIWLAKKGHAAPTESERPCVQVKIPVHITANNWNITAPRVDSNSDYVAWLDDLDTWSHPTVEQRTAGLIVVNTTFTILAQLCVPEKGTKKDILQIASHGLGFDHRYWDAEVHPETYSYVNAALAAGYSILTYDRLGTGKSDKADGHDIVQAATQIEILHELTSMARAGKLFGKSCKVSGNSGVTSYVPTKVVHVGHSYGSIITTGLLASYPNLSDAAVLTGFLLTAQVGKSGFASQGNEYAAENDPERFGDRSSGYVVPATRYDVELAFLRPGSFEPEMLDYAESIKQPNTLGEYLSTGAGLMKPVIDYKGPLQFFVGEFDRGFCGGDCNNAYSEEGLRQLYPGPSNISVYLQPGTGHGLALSKNATAGFQVIFDYLNEQGL